MLVHLQIWQVAYAATDMITDANAILLIGIQWHAIFCH